MMITTYFTFTVKIFAINWLYTKCDKWRIFFESRNREFARTISSLKLTNLQSPWFYYSMNVKSRSSYRWENINLRKTNLLETCMNRALDVLLKPRKILINTTVDIYITNHSNHSCILLVMKQYRSNFYSRWIRVTWNKDNFCCNAHERMQMYTLHYNAVKSFLLWRKLKSYLVQ